MKRLLIEAAFMMCAAFALAEGVQEYRVEVNAYHPFDECAQVMCEGPSMMKVSASLLSETDDLSKCCQGIDAVLSDVSPPFGIIPVIPRSAPRTPGRAFLVFHCYEWEDDPDPSGGPCCVAITGTEAGWNPRSLLDEVWSRRVPRSGRSSGS